MSGQIDLLFYQVGGRLYGSEVQDVQAVRPRTPGPGAILDSALGRPELGSRSLIVQGRELVIDRVLGVRPVDAGALHPVPPFAAACLRSRAVVGLAHLDGELTPLVDLSALVAEDPWPIPTT